MTRERPTTALSAGTARVQSAQSWMGGSDCSEGGAS